MLNRTVPALDLVSSESEASPSACSPAPIGDRRGSVPCAMKLDSFKVACSSCNLRELCLPVGLSQPQLVHLDTLVGSRKAIKRGAKVFAIGPEVDLTYPVEWLGDDLSVLGSLPDQVGDRFAKAERPMVIVGGEGFGGAEKSHKLRKAEDLNTQRETPIQIVPEDEFCRMAGVPTIDALRQQPEAERNYRQHVVAIYQIFPNTLIIWQLDHIEIWRAFPGRDDASHCDVEMTIYKPHDSTRPDSYWEKNRDIAIRTVLEEDFPLGERMQIGFESGATEEVIYGRNEPSLVHFHRSIRDALGVAA